jgi:DnaJ family protein C protein 9
VCISGSEEELSDLKRAYLNGKGDMDFILEAVPFSHTDEEPRLRELIQGLIDKGDVPEYKAFTNETPRKRERRKRKVIQYLSHIHV